jgi:hypothetical protein
MKRLFTVFAIVALTLTAAGLVLAQSGPFVGSWKLDVAKSKFDPGPAPQSQARTWDAAGKVSIEGINAAGKSMAYGYTLKVDGKDYPTMGAIPNGAQTVTTKRISANKVEANFTRDGKHAETATFSVSKDGKVLSILAKGTSPKDGTPFTNNTVWEKQ